MQNNKKVALVRQIDNRYFDSEIRGVAKVVSKDGGYALRLSLTNLSQRKDGLLFVYLDDKKYRLNDIYGGFFDCDEDFNGGVAIVFKTGEGSFPIAYGKFSQDAKTVWEMIKSEKNYDKGEEPIPKEKVVFSNEEYDDEAISLVDYYAVEESRKQGELNGKTNQTDDLQIFDERNEGSGEEEKESGTTSPYADEDGNSEQDGAFPTYYQRVKENLESIFSQNEKMYDLENMVANSRWVKVGSGENSYVVGIINYGNTPRYICYGIAGKYGNKPSQIKNYASFIPKSPFNLKGEGFWVMFQDAISGESGKL